MQHHSSGRGGPRPGSGQPKKAPTKVVRLREDIAEAALLMQNRGGSNSGIGAFIKAEARTSGTSPLVSGSVACGFPSPAEDHLDRKLCMNEFHGVGRPEVLFIRAVGDSMTGKGIYHDDIVTVDRAKEARNGSIIVACLNGDFLLKTYFKRQGKVILKAENPAFPNIEVPEAAEFFVWGVVTNCTKSF